MHAAYPHLEAEFLNFGANIHEIWLDRKGHSCSFNVAQSRFKISATDSLLSEVQSFNTTTATVLKLLLLWLIISLFNPLYYI